MIHDEQTVYLPLDVNPEPWTIGPIGYARRNGKMSAYVNRNAQLAAYQEAVADAARDVLPESHLLWTFPFTLQFFFWRQRADYTTAQARTARKHEADITNLCKSTEDALQGILFKNDRDTQTVIATMVEQGPEVHGRILVCAYPTRSIPFANDIPSSVAEQINSFKKVTLRSQSLNQNHPGEDTNNLF